MNSQENLRAIKVIGHRNPDTDSICSAIAYSRLKNIIDPQHPCKPCRAGLLNRETEFVLDYFQVPAPQLYTDVSPQIRDVDIRVMEGVDGEMSLRRAWMARRFSWLFIGSLVSPPIRGVLICLHYTTAWALSPLKNTRIFALSCHLYKKIVPTGGRDDGCYLFLLKIRSRMSQSSSLTAAFSGSTTGAAEASP